jgi:SAM-dependent methyltransferase
MLNARHSRARPIRAAAREYEIRKKGELGHFRKVESRPKKPSIQLYWAERYLRPKLQAVGFDSIDDFYLRPIVALCRTDPDNVIELVSIGAGNCQHEIRLATQLRRAGVENFCVHCLDINAKMLSRGRALAESRGVGESLGFVETDINEWDVDRHYSVCLAFQALHHFVELETVFAKVHEALSPGGTFIVNDMIGRNGHRRWPEALRYIEEIWRDMPDRYKYHHRLRQVDREYVDRDWSAWTFEGIRAQDILPLLMRFFEFEVFIAVGNVIDPFISRGYGPNFDMESEGDRAFIDRVADLDERLIDKGLVKPTQLIAHLRTEPVAEPRCYRHWTPKHCVRVPDGVSHPKPVPPRPSPRRKAARKKKIAIYGNWQAPAVSRMLEMCSPFDREFKIVHLRGVHAISEERQRTFLREIVPTLDVLIYQPVPAGYRRSSLFGAEQVKRRARAEKIISFPFLEFFGYQPRSGISRKVTPEADALCTQQFNISASQLLHYEHVVRSYLLGDAVSSAVDVFHEGEEGDLKRAMRRAKQSIEVMKEVEQSNEVDLPMSDFIAENFAERLLFHAPRHPSGQLLVEVCSRLIEHLSAEAEPEDIRRMRRLDPLRIVEYPLQAYVVEALDLRFPVPIRFASKDRVMDTGQMIESYYALYRMLDSESLQAIGKLFPRLASRARR